MITMTISAAKSRKKHHHVTGRLPYRTAEEIENAIAAIICLKNDAETRLNMIENALSHLQLARGNGKKK